MQPKDLRVCLACGSLFKPSVPDYRACLACAEEAAKRGPATHLPLVRSFNGTDLSYEERVKAGLSAPTKRGLFGVVDAGRACAAFELSLPELASLAGCEVDELTPPPLLRLSLPRGVFQTRRGFITADRDGDLWFGATGKQDGAGGLNWLRLKAYYGSRNEALRAAKKALR